MAVYEEYLNYRLTGRCSNPFWQRKFNGMSGGGGDTPGGGGDTPGGGDVELMSWEGVAYHIDKGDYKDVYSVGDMVPLDLGSDGIINMQIAAFDADTLADESGTAAISWLGKEVLTTGRRMNPAREGSSGAYTEGTGSVGGWEKCEMRAYLQNTILPMIPSDASSLITEVSKTQTAYNVSGNSFAQTTEDSVWIPASPEISANGIYFSLFPNEASRPALGNKSWSMRNAMDNGSFAYVMGTTGQIAKNTAQSTTGVRLGFCTGRTPT